MDYRPKLIIGLHKHISACKLIYKSSYLNLKLTFEHFNSKDLIRTVYLFIFTVNFFLYVVLLKKLNFVDIVNLDDIINLIITT